MVAALLVVLWWQMKPPAPPAAHAAVAVAASEPPLAAAEKPASTGAAPAEQVDPPAPEAESGKPHKMDPRSDEFFYKFDEVVPGRLTRNAATCYEGRHGQLHRNQSLKLGFKTRIVNGQVTIRDVKVQESTLNDPALETCFIQEVARSTWKDDELPDWEQEDELVLKPERGMKKFWRENVDYVGPEAPRL